MADQARPLKHDTEPTPAEESSRPASNSEMRLRGTEEQVAPTEPPSTEQRDTDPSLPPVQHSLLAHWSRLDTALSVRVLLVEDKASDATSLELVRLLRCFLSDVRDVGDVLYELQCDLREWGREPVIPTRAWFGYVERVYGWLTGALDQVEETVSLYGDDVESIAWSMRSLVEYSSLYVRGLLEPESAAAIELHRQAGDLRTLELLSTLHERIVWLGFTIKSFENRRARGAC